MNYSFIVDIEKDMRRRVCECVCVRTVSGLALHRSKWAKHIEMQKHDWIEIKMEKSNMHAELLFIRPARLRRPMRECVFMHLS